MKKLIRTAAQVVLALLIIPFVLEKPVHSLLESAGMTGKYSYLATAESGDEELLLMNVLSFGDNLYAFCGLALPEATSSAFLKRQTAAEDALSRRGSRKKALPATA